jgi:hypothetical protein
MQKVAKYKVPADYSIIVCICISLVIIAFALDTPAQIAEGYNRINTSRSVLITDYIALGGIGAALLNAAISGFFYLFILIAKNIKPTGKIVLALFLTIGFSLFGKNIFNMLPIFFGVWIYAKIRKKRLRDYIVQAMLSGTVAPLVSEIAFLDESTSVIKIIAACGVGLFVGIIFPVIIEAAKRMHRGYCLYNGGVAGGFISTFFVGVLTSVGIVILPENYWDTEHTAFLATFTYVLSFVLILYGIAADRPRNAFQKYKQLLKEKDVDDNDYLIKYGNTCYINIGIMCIVSTSLMLFLKIPINGPVLGGILTVVGFAAAGKHLRNSIPVLLGSTIAAHFNFLDVNTSVNSLAILFSTGLAPIAGKHGWHWGIVVGFIHVSVAIIIGDLNGGLNLYNNGFAGGFLAITVVPIIVFIKEIVYKRNFD